MEEQCQLRERSLAHSLSARTHGLALWLSLARGASRGEAAAAAVVVVLNVRRVRERKRRIERTTTAVLCPSAPHGTNCRC